MEQFTLRIRKEDLQKVRDVAKEQDRSVNYIISQIIYKSLKGE